MIKNDKKLTSYQFIILLLCSVFGIGILQLPAGLTEKVGNEAWLNLIMIEPILLLAVFFMCKAGSLYNGDSFVGASQKTFGKILGIILVIPIVILGFIAACTETEIFSMAIRIFLIDRTPNYAILIPFLFLVMFLTRGELKDILRFFQFMVPFVSILIIFIYLLAIPGSDFTRLLPVFQRSIGEYVEGMKISTFSYLGIVNILIIYPYIKNKELKKTFKQSSISVFIITAVYIITNALCITKLGVGETKWLIHPTVSLIKSAYIPGGFIERLEGVLMGLWVIIAFTTLCTIVYSIAVVISDICRFKHSKHVVTIIVPIIYFFSISVISVLDVHIINRMNDLTLGVYSIFIFPLLFILVNRIRFKKRGVNNGS